MKVEKVVCPTDFSPCASHALELAVLVARSFGAELHVLHAVVLHAEDPHNPAHHLPNLEEVQALLERTAASALARDIAPHADGVLRILQVQRRAPFAGEAILGYAEEIGADLIVMGTHGRRGLAHVLLGSVANEVVRGAPCPVMTVRTRPEGSHLAAIERILVPIDFSGASETALATARDLAVQWTASLDLLHVIEETVMPAFYAAGVTSLLQLHPEIRTRCQAEMQRRLAQLADASLTVATHVREGRAAQEIVAFAEERESDLIVLATASRSGVERLLLGSVAEKVVRLAPCPVLVVRARQAQA
ncbi:MAG: universal stress protein [Acidobacteriota bacterium]|jgi:nucleotide-binding universal stress UspA family protein